MLYSGCSKKHPAPPSITDQQIDLLTKGAWKVTAATKDNVDEMAIYGNVVMTITGAKGQTATPITMTYTISGRTSTKKYPWQASGKFDFDPTDPATILTRDGAEVVTYAVTATQLTMSFNYGGPGFIAREGVVTGNWLFTLIRSALNPFRVKSPRALFI